jgi:hypothetical protein
MAYKSKARRKEKELREPIPGNGTSFPPGKKYNVTVESIAGGGDVINVTFRNAFDELHVERIFLMNKSSDDLSGILKQLIAAIATNSAELKGLYDAMIKQDITVFGLMLNRSCIIETEYRGEYVNIKTIRSGNDRDSSGSFFQSVEADTSQPEGTIDIGEPKRYLALSKEAESFF